jgi:uracil phosphoribosyltransferase
MKTNVIFANKNSIVNQFLHELRDLHIQKDRNKFRNNISRIGEIIAYEISKTLEYVPHLTTTPMGIAETSILKEQPVIATVLRAGLPLQAGLNNCFDQADLAYISAYRHHTSPISFEIIVEYLACPDLTDRILILADPMLATGQSLVLTYEQFMKQGKPKEVHLVSVIGSKEGVAYVNKHMPEAQLWIGVIDDELNEEGYIVPGLGDAGDLSFGEKKQH